MQEKRPAPRPGRAGGSAEIILPAVSRAVAAGGSVAGDRWRQPAAA
ncbi:MAG: hypothetical protein JW810_10315 [Sedimentisphaerales bacterium]|nr:hypothetical protein [Sedimentisphaerales bacterium]